MRDLLISDEYRALNAQVHASDARWGQGGLKHIDEVLKAARLAQANTAIDYGCGKGMMAEALRDQGMKVTKYDPAMPGYDSLPNPADFLYSLDVLEHVEPGRLDAVLAHMAGLADMAYMVIALRPARQKLPDGRNAHLIVENADYWVGRLLKHYRSVAQWPCENMRELRVLCSR